MVGFLILNYNSWGLTRSLARKVELYESIDKIVVVDNMSTDDSFEHLRLIKSEKIEIIQTDKNGGYSYGNNVGAKRCYDCGVDILFISNPDVSVEEDDIIKILNQFQNSEYAVLSGVEYNHGRINQPPIWNLGTYESDVLECFFLGRKAIKKYRKLYLDLEKEVQEAEIIKGSFFAVRLDDFISVGGFDDKVFLYCEERILARKIATLGKRLGIITDAKYQHNHSSSIAKKYKKRTSQMKLLYKSMMYYNLKYNKIGKFKTKVLRFAMGISIMEFQFVDIILSIKSGFLK